jgi:hypothetical protein
MKRRISTGGQSIGSQSHSKEEHMKSTVLKSVGFACVLLAAWYCTDNTAAPLFGEIAEASETVWVIDIGPDNNLYVANDGTVYDSQWNVFGTYENNNIITSTGEVFMMAVDTTNRETAVIIGTSEGTKLVELNDGTVTDIEGHDIGTIDESGNIVNNNGKVIAENKNSSTSTFIVSSTSIQSSYSNVVASSVSTQTGNCDGQCYDKASGKCVAYYAEQVGPKGEKYAYDKTCNLNCYWDPNNKGCADVGNIIVVQSSSSSKQNTVTSSSSRQQSTGPSLLPKIIGSEKDGYATRYWDSCKPHCAWSGKGGPIARTCHRDGSRAGVDEASACDGGPAGTCTDQTPQIINDTIAYAFAATPGGGNDCGKCYMLTFKGTGASATNTPTEDSHRSIKGKHLIVMSNNIGYDVSHNQFDLMIPGGGPGAYNGCGNMGLSCAGAQYGGFLTTCNYSKSCLINMCNQEYANNTSMKNGCLFLANWMNAANNPEVKFVEVECPSALSAKY